MMSRFMDIDLLLDRRGSFTGPNFSVEMNEDGAVSDFVASTPILCVGAGGLGCEILKDLALTGFQNVHVIDMDTIDVTNLNRQFLFRPVDVGKSKADIAAARVMERVQGVKVTSHFCKIQDKDDDFYDQFAVIVLGLDSVEARQYMNMVACKFLEYKPDGSVDPLSVKHMVDGGTEGFKGHARIIIPGTTPCFDCTMWLFPPQIRFPLCTLAETPRLPAHCIEYAHLVLWGRHHPESEPFDSDNEAHMQWVYERALERAQEHNIQGVTLQYTQGVVKNIIPAVPSTNAIVAAACVLETLKIVTHCFTTMENYMMYSGTHSVYTHTVKYERDTSCPVCGAGDLVRVTSDMTLQQVLDAMVADEALREKLSEPSVSLKDGEVLYMRGPLEASYRSNLSKTMEELAPGGLEDEDKCLNLVVTDKKWPHPIRVRLAPHDSAMDGT